MNDVLSSDETCKYLKMSKTTLLRYTQSGSIPGFKVGKRWKFSKQTLEEWINMRAKQDTDARFKSHLRKI